MAIDYNTAADPKWKVGVDSWDWEPMVVDGGRVEAWSKSGKCPTCGDDITIVTGLVAGLADSADTVVEPTVNEACNCEVKHAEGHRGCGQSADIKAPPKLPPQGPRASDMHPDVDLNTWRSEYETARHSALADVRATAAKWAASLAVLLAIAGTASTIIVPKTLDKFNNTNLEYAVFSAALVAALTAVVALAFATYAAQGRPELNAVFDVRAYRRLVIDGAVSSAKWLERSRRITALAVAFVLVAAVCSQIDTFLEVPKHSNVLVVGTDGKIHCGQVSNLNITVTSVIAVEHC